MSQRAFAEYNGREAWTKARNVGSNITSRSSTCTGPLYAAIEHGFAAPLPEFVRTELEGYLTAACSAEASLCFSARARIAASNDWSRFAAKAARSARPVWDDGWRRPQRI
jgi:hypothetical protein